MIVIDLTSVLMKILHVCIVCLEMVIETQNEMLKHVDTTRVIEEFVLLDAQMRYIIMKLEILSVIPPTEC